MFFIARNPGIPLDHGSISHCSARDSQRIAAGAVEIRDADERRPAGILPAFDEERARGCLRVAKFHLQIRRAAMDDRVLPRGIDSLRVRDEGIVFSVEGTDIGLALHELLEIGGGGGIVRAEVQAKANVVILSLLPKVLDISC